MESRLLRLNLLGGATLATDAGDAITFPTRKALGLFAYIAMQGGQGAARDTLAGLYWSESPDQNARASLRRTLHELTQALGPLSEEVMEIGRDRVALKQDAVAIDALEFDAAGRFDDLVSLRQAAKLYAGRFLAGFPTESEAFATWQSTEAMRLEDLALVVFGRLAERALQSGRVSEAMEVSLLMLDVDPLHEHACRLQMRALATAGRRSEALRRYDAFAELLTAEMQTDPEAETTTLYEHIRSGESASPGAPLREPEIPSIVVLPVRNDSGDDEHAFIGEAFTENLTTALGRDKSLFVISRNSAEVYRDTCLTPPEIAADLGIRYLIFTSLQVFGGRLRINIQLVNGSDGSHVWTEQYERPLAALFEVHDEIVGRIVASLRGYKGVLQRAELKASRSRQVTDLSTYEKLMRGMQHKEKFQREDMLIARRYFERAVAEHPEFAMAHAWVAWTWFFDIYMGWVEDTEASLDNAFETSREAVRLDPDLDFAHWALGAAYLAAGDNNSSLRAFDEALRLNPNNSDALANKAWPLTFDGQADEAVSNIESAIRLNPYYPDWYLWGMGIAQYSRGEPARAVDALDQMEQPNAQSLAYLTAASLESGNPGKAQTAAENLLRLEPGFAIEQLIRGLPYNDNHVPDRLYRGLIEIGLT